MNRKKSAEINIDILDKGHITIDGNRINLIKAAKKSNKEAITFCLLGTKKEEDYTTAKDYDNLHIYRSIPTIDIITNPVYYQEIRNNNENAIPTIVAYSTSSDINDTFSFLNKGTIGDCLRNSNLSIIYKKRKKLIKEMVKVANINDAVVLEIPNLIFYLRDGIKLRSPMVYNLIVIYFNIPDKMSNSQAQEIYKKISLEIPNKTMEAALLSNSKHLLLNPLDITDKFNISKYVKNWKNTMNSMKFKDNISSLTFVINDENQEEFFQTKKKVLEYYDIKDAGTV